MIAIYARQSRDKKDSISIDSQFEFCMKEVLEGEKVKNTKIKVSVARILIDQIFNDY